VNKRQWFTIGQVGVRPESQSALLACEVIDHVRVVLAFFAGPAACELVLFCHLDIAVTARLGADALDGSLVVGKLELVKIEV